MPALLKGQPIFDKMLHLYKPPLPNFEKILEGLKEIYENGSSRSNH